MASSQTRYEPYPRPTALDCSALFRDCRDRRRLTDYCNVFAEKTSRITRSVQGRFYRWRSLAVPACPREGPTGAESFPDVTLRQVMRGGTTTRSYGMNYETGERYEEVLETPRGDRTSVYSRDIIRSLEELELGRIQRQPPHVRCCSQDLLERPQYYPGSSSPQVPVRRSQSINLEEHFRPHDIRRLCRYPKSLQDLTYLEIEAILDRDPISSRPESYPPNRRPRSMSASRFEGASTSQGRAGDVYGGRRIEMMEPGKIHYEKEYRIYGKDTVALIFYKTCYL